jgi:hypothetical protein
MLHKSSHVQRCGLYTVAECTKYNWDMCWVEGRPDESDAQTRVIVTQQLFSSTNPPSRWTLSSSHSQLTGSGRISGLSLSIQTHRLSSSEWSVHFSSEFLDFKTLQLQLSIGVVFACWTRTILKLWTPCIFVTSFVRYQLKHYLHSHNFT